MNEYIKDYQEPQKTFDQGLQTYMLRVYNHVALALLVTAMAAAITLSFKPLTLLMFNFDVQGSILGHTGFGYFVAFSPFFITLYLGNGFNIKVQRFRLLGAIYAILTGMSLASLAFLYTGASLSRTFFIASAMFGGMSLYGYTTKRDMTGMGSFFTMALWGIILSSLINMFLQSEAVYFITSLVGVAVFTGLIAFRTQQLKSLYYELQGSQLEEKASLMGAFTLYLSFLNLFLFLLRFLGQRSRRN